MFYLLTYLKR